MFITCEKVFGNAKKLYLQSQQTKSKSIDVLKFIYMSQNMLSFQKIQTRGFHTNDAIISRYTQSNFHRVKQKTMAKCMERTWVSIRYWLGFLLYTNALNLFCTTSYLGSSLFKMPTMIEY